MEYGIFNMSYEEMCKYIFKKKIDIKVGDIVYRNKIFVLITYTNEDIFGGIKIPEGKILSLKKTEDWKIYRRTTHMKDVLEDLMKTAELYADL